MTHYQCTLRPREKIDCVECICVGFCGGQSQKVSRIALSVKQCDERIARFYLGDIGIGFEQLLVNSTDAVAILMNCFVPNASYNLLSDRDKSLLELLK